MLMELSHLQEVMDKLEVHTSEPYSLPQASEQVKTKILKTHDEHFHVFWGESLTQ